MDWTSSMKQTFEYYKVDPISWKEIEKIDNIISSNVDRDLSLETLCSAYFSTTEEYKECYIRIYLVVSQNDETVRECLGTYLVQTPSISSDGKILNITLDAYSPLLELKEKLPPIGFTVLKEDRTTHQSTKIMSEAYKLTRDNTRTPVIDFNEDINVNLLEKDFVAESDENWLSYISSLMKNANYSFSLDETNRITFAPNQSIEKMNPKWVYTDDNSSILQSNITMTRDLYMIPNVVEVVATIIHNNQKVPYITTIKNESENSPTSIQNRGREIVYRETNPEIPGNPSKEMVDNYAKDLLKKLSTLEYEISYTHGYCPVRIGDCIRLNYKKIGIINEKAKVIKQSIDCTTSCQVSETAVYSKELWTY